MLWLAWGAGSTRKRRWRPWAPGWVAATGGMIVLGCLLVVTRAHAGGKALDGVINLNTAPVELLGVLPGIGPSKARAIVAYRLRRPFRTVDELVRVKGIGRRMVRELRPHLAINGPSTARGTVHLTVTAPVAPALPPAGVRPPVCRPAILAAPRGGSVRNQSARDRRALRAPANHCAPPA